MMMRGNIAASAPLFSASIIRLIIVYRIVPQKSRVWRPLLPETHDFSHACFAKGTKPNASRTKAQAQHREFSLNSMALGPMIVSRPPLAPNSKQYPPSVGGCERNGPAINRPVQAPFARRNPTRIVCNSPELAIFFVDIGSESRYNRKVDMGVFLCLAGDKNAHRLIE